MKFTITALTAAAAIILSCGPVKYDGEVSKIQIINVVDPTEAEVIYKGKRTTVSLAGIHFITEYEYKERYLKENKIDAKYDAEITDAIKEGDAFFKSLVSEGDLLYAVDLTGGEKSARASAFIVYMPDLVSINEKMVSAGYAVPEKGPFNPAFNDLIEKRFKESVAARKGLWRIGKIILNEKQ
jgi:endonuclease YncB( thermonuclease family)